MQLQSDSADMRAQSSCKYKGGGFYRGGGGGKMTVGERREIFQPSRAAPVPAPALLTKPIGRQR